MSMCAQCELACQGVNADIFFFLFTMLQSKTNISWVFKGAHVEFTELANSLCKHLFTLITEYYSKLNIKLAVFFCV